MSKLQLLCPLLFLSVLVAAQSHTTYGINTVSGIGFTNNTIRIENQFSNKEAKKYLIKDWTTEGSIRFKGKMVKVTGLNYNMARDRFELRFHKDSIMAFDRTIRYINLGERSFELMRLPDSKSYCEVLSDGDNFTLLKTFKYREREATPNPKMLTNNNQKVITVLHKYYLKDKKQKKIVPFKLRKKEVNKVFQLEGKSVKDFMKTKKLSYKKEASIKQLCLFFNNM